MYTSPLFLSLSLSATSQPHSALFCYVREMTPRKSTLLSFEVRAIKSVVLTAFRGERARYPLSDLSFLVPTINPPLFVSHWYLCLSPLLSLLFQRKRKVSDKAAKRRQLLDDLAMFHEAQSRAKSQMVSVKCICSQMY